jgi:hypothetical protein
MDKSDYLKEEDSFKMGIEAMNKVLRNFNRIITMKVADEQAPDYAMAHVLEYTKKATLLEFTKHDKNNE